MPQRITCTAQPDLLAWTAPDVVARFAPERVKGATWEMRFSRAISETLHDCGASREEIAVRMSGFLGEKVSVAMLNAYASTARTEHRMNLGRLLALLVATGDRRLLEMIAGECGWAVVERKFLPMIELAAVQEAKARLEKRANVLRAAAKEGGAL